MVRAQRTQLNLLAAALVAGTVAIACGGSDGGDNGGGGSPEGGTTAGNTGGMTGGTGNGQPLTLAFNPMYSAFDGTHEFNVPVKVAGASGKLTVTTTPPDFVDYEPSMDGVMLTTRKPGEATVTITDAAGNSGTAKLYVTDNDPGDVDIGKERYANGNDAFNLPEGGIMLPGLPEGGFTWPEGGFPEGGFPRPDGGWRLPEGGLGITRNPMAACTFCHVPEGAPAEETDMARIDVEHTPQQTAGFSDEDLIKIFTEGVKPMGAPFRVVNGGGILPDATAQRIYTSFHKWDVEEPTQKGIVAYLRSLEPKPQGEIDFGGLLRGGAGGLLGGTRGTMDAGAP